MIDIMLLYPSILHEHNFNRMQMCLSYLTFIHKISLIYASYLSYRLKHWLCHKLVLYKTFLAKDKTKFL